MTRAFKISTIKHEAETYLSQGLYKEALMVYRNFLVNIKELDPALRKIVDESMGRIKTAARDHNCEKEISMGPIETAAGDHNREKEVCMPGVIDTLPKRASEESTSVNDRLVNAQSFIDLGCYERALEEYRRLLKNNYLTSAVMRGVALCLVHLVQPKQIVNVVDQLATEMFKHPRNRNAFKLSISKKISKDKYPRHFSALTRHLYEINGEST